MMQEGGPQLQVFREALKDYLTFYHEIQTPAHPFFVSPANRDDSTPVLMTSSPSRMGNHLLLSLLDNHPQLPRIPGEDGFLSFSFFQANYDLKQYLTKVRDERDEEYIRALSTNLFYEKWSNLKQFYERDEVPENYSGVGIKDRPADIDFQDTVFDVSLNAYERALAEGLSDEPLECFRDFFNVYLRALLHLDPAYESGRSPFKGYISYSGMRAQVRWVLEYYEHAVLVTSLRPFESYAVSHIKSRNARNELTDELVQEAWEHWYHKVIDYLYLKSTFPDRVCLVSFDDMRERTEDVGHALCRFLKVDYCHSMCSPSVFGVPVKGNSSRSRGDASRGKIYSNATGLPPERVPDSCRKLWDSFMMVKTI